MTQGVLDIWDDEDLSRVRWNRPLAGGEPRNSRLTGLRTLMLAVFEDGVRCYLRGKKIAAAEAECWIQSRERSTPFTFVVICETLGLDPDAVRAALEQMKARQGPRRTLRRARHNVRIPGRVAA